MKKLLLSLFLLSLPALAAEKIQLYPNTDYIYFSDAKIISVNSSDAKVIKGKPIDSYTGENSQILFSSHSKGCAKVDINTDNGIISYEIEVCEKLKNKNDVFVEIDIPKMKAES